jgi:lipopolysaccharide biosynthesis glycosyltransferase
VADLAYVTVCIKTPDPQNNFGGYEYYDQCLASICSLLGTTNPKTVIVMVDEHFPDNARKALESQGVQLVLLRDKAYTVWPDSAKYPAERFANHPRLHTFQKLAIFNMTQFKNVFWLDSDVEVKTNLTAYFETLPKDRVSILTLSFISPVCPACAQVVLACVDAERKAKRAFQLTFSVSTSWTACELFVVNYL